MPINREAAINDFLKLEITNNNEGLIPAFDVFIQRLPSDFWNNFSRKILEVAGDDLYESAEGLLEHAAAECGYHTGHGVLSSDEFNAVVGPHLENKQEDLLHAAYCVFTAWGWGDAEIVELVPDEKLVVRAYDYYEADVENPKKHFAYMIRGVSRAFMDLVYSQPYPNGFGKFTCEQVKGIEMGDKYGEFVVTRAEE